LRRPKSTTSETCSHRELVSVRFAATRYTKNSLQTISYSVSKASPISQRSVSAPPMESALPSATQGDKHRY